MLRVGNLGLPKSGAVTKGKAQRQAGLRLADCRILRGQRKTERGPIGRLMYDGCFESGDPRHYHGDCDAFAEIDFVSDGRALRMQTHRALLSGLWKNHPCAEFVLSVRTPEIHADPMRRWSNLGTKRLPRRASSGLLDGYGGKRDELERWMAGPAAFCRQVCGGSSDFLECDVAVPEVEAKVEACLAIAFPWCGRVNVNEAHPNHESET